MSFKRFILAATPLLFMSCHANPAMANPQRTPRDEPELGRCIHEAAQGSLWLEKTLWGLRDQEAGWIGADITNTNGTHDLGPLQVNSAWVPRLSRLVKRPTDQIQQWLRFDPCFNTQAARWIFLSALGQTHDFWKAVGTYYSPTIWRQQRYMVSVAGHLRRRFGQRLFLASADQESTSHRVGE